MSSPAVRLYAWMKNTKPTYHYDGCKLSFRYAEIISTTVRNSPTKVMLEFETSVPFIDPPKSFALHLVNEWNVKTDVYLVLFYAYSNNKNRYTIVVTPRNAPKPSRHHRSKGSKVPKSEERIQFQSSSTSSLQPSDASNAEAELTKLDVQSSSDSESVCESGVFSEIDVEVHPQADGGVKCGMKTAFFNNQQFTIPILKTSKAIQTTDESPLPSEIPLPEDEEVTNIVRVEKVRPTYARVVKGTSIPMNYESDGFKDKIAMSYLSRNDVFERVRLQLAFFRHERDVNVNLMSYVSNKIYLINSGVAAQNDNHLEHLYFKFCEEKGLTREEVQLDLKNTEHAIRTKRLNYLNAARKNFFEFYCTDHSRSKVIIKQPHKISVGRCDPEVCTLM